MVNGKNKGSSYERAIAKKLSLWLSKGKMDSVFWRTSNSGGRYTIRFKQGKETKNQDGDITSIHPAYDWFSNFYSIECKAYRDINLWSLLTDLKGSNIKTFWQQTINQANDSNKNPLLFVKQNRKTELVVISSKNKKLIENFYGEFIPKLIIPHLGMNIYLLESFLELDISTLQLMIEKNFR